MSGSILVTATTTIIISVSLILQDVRRILTEFNLPDYGYFLSVAAVIAKYDSSWLSQHQTYINWFLR
jgi:hypothetical protein